MFERIQNMEAIYDRVIELLKLKNLNYMESVELNEGFKSLEAYYTSKDWKEDFKADEEGKLPKDLKRGVLSEDGIYNLLERKDEKNLDSPSKRIYEAVKRIPYGHVATYAQVAEAAGDRKMARAVGNALHKNPDPDNIPCYRVVNSKGELAAEFAFGGAVRQQKLLEAEGIEVIDRKVSLVKYQWKELKRF